MIISDDFDSAAAGETPPGWSTILGYGLVDNSRTPQAGSAAVIDNSKAYSGANSVRVSTPNQMSPHAIFQALPANLSTLYVRAWVYSPDQLGGGSATGGGNHAHFLGTLEIPGQDSGVELRFGPVNGGYLGGFMPKYSDSYTNLKPAEGIPANTWTCVEWAVENNPSYDRMYAWVNDKPVMEATSVDNWQNKPMGDFFNNDSAKYVSFGWRKFGSGADVSDIWFDDIAVSTKRIGCE